MAEDRRVVLSLMDGSSLATTNPFQIADELRRLVGEVVSATPNAAGKLTIVAANEEQVETLLKQDHFLKKRVSLTAPGRSVEAYAYAPSLTEVSDQELLSNLEAQGVIGVTRLRAKPGKRNPGIRLRFRGGTFPPTIRAGFQDIALRPWQRSPLLCRQCASYGHLQKHCRAAYRRCLRCAQDHYTDDCKSSTCRCPHCTGDHPAWDRRCQSLADYVKKREDPNRRPPENRSTGPTAEAASQTTNSSRTASTMARPATVSAATGPDQPPTRSTAAQTDDLHSSIRR